MRMRIGRAIFWDVSLPYIYMSLQKMASRFGDAKKIARQMGVDAELIDKPCEDVDIPSLVSFIIQRREVFGILLCERDLADVEAENMGCSEQVKRLASLRKWKATCGSDATYAALISALVENGRYDKAEALCERLVSDAAKEQGRK